MTIEEVITQTILALYEDSSIASHLRLKGGSALRLFDHLTSRLSIDADFSLSTEIADDKEFFGAVKSAVGTHFRKRKYDMIDFKWTEKPKKVRKSRPNWWGGWQCEFKLLEFKHRGKTLDSKRRHALKPEGANSPKIIIDISRHEYCGKKRTRTINGVKVFGYTRELIVLEKLRAICQQHADYPYSLHKNRARDFYDIYELTNDTDDGFMDHCRPQLDKVFSAKEVPLDLLNALWDEDFIDTQQRGFDEVKNDVSGKLQTFDVYLEHLRFLVKELRQG